jgi:hypothetical protein
MLELAEFTLKLHRRGLRHGCLERMRTECLYISYFTEKVKGAVAGGDYASNSEVVRDWKLKRAHKQLSNFPGSPQSSDDGIRMMPVTGSVRVESARAQAIEPDNQASLF